MQTRGTFPALNDGRSKGRRRNSGTFAREDRGMTAFPVSGRVRRPASNPRTFAGRRAASHRKAHGR